MASTQTPSRKKAKDAKLNELTDPPAASGYGVDGEVARIKKTLTGVIEISGENKLFSPALTAIACVPGRDIITSFKDISSSANNLLLEAGNTAAFSVSDKFTTTAGSGSPPGGLVIPKERVQWNPFSESLFISLKIGRAIPASTDVLLAIGNNTGSNCQGFRLNHQVTTGYLGIGTYNNAGASLGTPWQYSKALDATERVIAIAFDAPSGSWFMWFNGSLVVADVNFNVGAAAFADSISQSDLRIGGFSGANLTVALSASCLQAYKVVGGLPHNIGLLAAQLAENPGKPLEVIDWQPGSNERNLIAVLGQSNEMGPGPTTFKTMSAGAGCPCADPIKPTGFYNTFWPYVAQMSAKRNKWTAFRTHAIGATALTSYWCGRVVTWSASKLVHTGVYALYGGKLWKCLDANTTNSNAYGVSTVAPSAVTGADNISWQDLGAPTASDFDGAVYAEGSARFDPNGKLATILADLVAAKGYDKKAVAISIGDLIESTAAQYAQAMINIANYFTSRGYYVILGGTVCSRTAGVDDALYTPVLLPGRLQALSALASNPLVVAGASLRDDLGLLPVMPATGPGMQVDEVHMNADAMLLAGRAWDTQLAKVGF